MATITFTIPDNKLAEFKAGFLKSHPIPQDDDGNPLYTENDWIKEAIRQMIMHSYQAGKERIARESTQPSIDTNIIS